MDCYMAGDGEKGFDEWDSEGFDTPEGVHFHQRAGRAEPNLHGYQVCQTTL